LVKELRAEEKMGNSRACRLLRISRSSLAYVSIKDDSELYEALVALCEKHPREGFWKCYFRMRNQGKMINHKRLHRIYKKEGLSMRRKSKKRKVSRIKEPLEIPSSFTHSWSIDFMSDALENGRKIRTFNVIDDFNREVLHIEADYSIKSSRVVWILKQLVNRYGKPRKIRMDNGPEFISHLIQTWSIVNDIRFTYIQPGKPTQNSLIERFNKTFREGVLDAHLFCTLDEVREVVSEWIEDYNHYRPHDALGGLSPVMWKNGQQATAKATAFPDNFPTSANNNNKKLKEITIFEQY
jgi:putative transposase